MTAVTSASPAAGKPAKPPRKKYFKNFLKYRYLLRELVNKNIKLQYRNSVPRPVLDVFTAVAYNDRAEPDIRPDIRP